MSFNNFEAEAFAGSYHGTTTLNTARRRITEFKTDLVFLGVYFYYANVFLLKINKRVGEEKLFSLFSTSEELTVVQWASQGNSF